MDPPTPVLSIPAKSFYKVRNTPKITSWFLPTTKPTSDRKKKEAKIKTKIKSEKAKKQKQKETKKKILVKKVLAQQPKVSTKKENEENSIKYFEEVQNPTSIVKSEDVEEAEKVEWTYDMIRERNIERRKSLFKELQIAKAKSDLASSLGLDQANTKLAKPSKRGLASTTREKEPQGPPRKSLRLQKIDADLSIQLPDKEPTSYFIHTVDDRPRPPLGDLDLHDVADWKKLTPDEDHIVKEKSQYLQALTKDLKSNNVSPKKKNSFEGNLEKQLKSLKITEEQVAKVTPSRIFSMAIHPSESKLIVAVGDKWGVLGLWDVRDTKSDKHGVEVFYPHSRPINCMSFDNFDSNRLITTSYDGSVRSFDLEAQKFGLVYGTADDDYTYTGYHCQIDAHTFLVSLGSTGLVGLVDTRESNLKRSHDFKVYERVATKMVSVHPLEKHLFMTPTNKGDCSIFDMRGRNQKLTPVMSLQGHTKGISSALFSPLTGKSVVTVCYDNKVRIYDVTSRKAEMKPRVQISHNNQTGRWLTTFKAEWHPSREDLFFVGSMSQPRKLDVFTDSGSVFQLEGEYLTSICSIVKVHPSQNVILGGNSSGRVFSFM